MAAVLARLALGLAKLRRLTRTARVLDGRTRVSPALGTPLTWGVIRPVILLPSYVLDWPVERRELVMQHERLHIERKDWLWQGLAQALTAIFWFHPLVWLAVSRLRQEAEHAVDDAVLAGGADAASYAGQLLAVAKQLGEPVRSPAAAMVRNPALGSRIAAILDGSRPRTRANGRTRTAVTLVAAAAVVLLAACQKNQVYRIGPGITPPRVQSKVEPGYTEEARTAKTQGTVVLSVIITPQGRAEAIRVVKSLDPGLDRKAIDAINGWSFEPGTRNGKPVRVAATIEVNFRLL
jgi:TonB family protein